METQNNIKIYEAHDLIGAHESALLVKLNQMDAPTRLGVAKSIIIDLLALLGVSGESSDPRHHARAITFVATSLGNYSAEEIIFAFHQAVKGEYNIEIYQQLNSVIIGRVMREYTQWLRAKTFSKKETTLERIDRETIGFDEEQFNLVEKTDRLKRDLKTHGKFTEDSKLISEVYQYLHKKKELPNHTTEFRIRIKTIATPLAKAKAMGMVQAGKLPRGYLKGEIEKIESGQSEIFKTTAQEVILTEYFKTNE